MNFPEAMIVYCSPNGTTAKVAEKILNVLKNHKLEANIFNLAKKEEIQNANQRINELKTNGKNPILFIGCPVYASKPVPPAMNFIENLQETDETFTVPFITWGGVTKGFALYGLAEALNAKGYITIGAAEVLAEHSMTWKADKPVAKGHPDSDDLAEIEKLVNEIINKISTNNTNSLDLSLFKNERSGNAEDILKIPFDAIRSKMPQKTVKEDLCNQCRICAEKCPADAIDFSPYPVFNDNCIVCYSCVKECPEEAIHFPAEVIMNRVKEKAEKTTEENITSIYI